MANIFNYITRKESSFCASHELRDKGIVPRMMTDLDWWLSRNFEYLRDIALKVDHDYRSNHDLKRAIFRDELDIQFFKDHLNQDKCPSCISDSLIKIDTFHRDIEEFTYALNEFDAKYDLDLRSCCDSSHRLDTLKIMMLSEIESCFDLTDENLNEEVA